MQDRTVWLAGGLLGLTAFVAGGAIAIAEDGPSRTPPFVGVTDEASVSDAAAPSDVPSPTVAPTPSGTPLPTVSPSPREDEMDDRGDGDDSGPGSDSSGPGHGGSDHED